MMQFTDEMMKLAERVEEKIKDRVRDIESIAEQNQWKVIQAFQRHQVSDYHFAGSTGYGYNDRGREVLDEVYADVFGAEAALVRPHFVSGTHTIATALFAVLRPGDELLYITGTPYDTLHKVIGQEGDGTGSLRDWGIQYGEVELSDEGQVNWAEVERRISPRTRVIGIQRSRGYAWRTSFRVDEIADMVTQVKRLIPDAIVFVDNCYGEFTERLEPTEAGADIIAGSLIKNPGGGIAETGGYIAGKRRFVEAAAARLSAPGIGGEVGAMLGMTRAMYQGLFLAPSIVGQAVRGSVFAAAMFEELGFESSPHWSAPRTDLIQAIRFDSAEHLIAFVQGIQKASAVDAHVVPVPWEMPGYEHPVIMAAGTFIQGGSLELSADAPIREPYTAYMQGGLTYAHAKLGAMTALSAMVERGLLKLS
ncbi:methionine gamma-lyase family protein [Paenibacillus thiaminolyticus]|uniref:Methionine gamma-lyase family protein n=2 Tax=Paenibacillus thiaminolyticus TaxID=49283 RepID=A0ABT4FX77_PANTH|nr:methionine gamma-lyase family protein [Paenibacillus thiaminolyticus]MCY9535818.1 methionine gamma-lyase family protein [Paenibacillus thiaminolyticus]MCY9605405.1 methionine gamma-lyase family protein [Paenibacillus thiaminolyticus]MCY9608630.1 methionine gamma-lyase family protein [Paenibacillus thiaminolyticus]MCY9613376.1 methionine gamma-lyase family protein [Paenibacillus thiaminolyticus]MCY9619550.1 methionine gamma-lyase family protein [Paenibacillus thiaminolyticus]